MLGFGLPKVFAALDSAPAADAPRDWVAMVLRELARSQAGGFAVDLVICTLLGAGLGVVLAIGTCVIFSRLGWYDLNMRFARGLRWAIFLLITALSAILFGIAGFWDGAVRGSERVLSRSQLATEVFPRIADVVADAMAWVQVHAAQASSTNAVDFAARVDEFRAGKWELHCAQFLQQWDQLQEKSVTNALAKLEASAIQSAPQLKGGIGERLLRQCVGGFGRLLVEKKVTSELRGWGVDQIYRALRQQLTVEAAKAGNAETIQRSELSQFIIREGIVPGVMKPIGSTARAQQLGLGVAGAGVILMPPVCVRLAKAKFGGARKTRTSAAGAPPVIRP